MPDLANNSNPSLSSPLAVSPSGSGGAAGAGLKSASRALAGVVPDREPARERNPHPQNGGKAARTLGDYVADWAAQKAGSSKARSRCFLPFLVGTKRMVTAPVGVGMCMEGIEQNPVVYELMSEMAFRTEKILVVEWLKAYS